MHRRTAGDEVLSNPDLVAQILTGTIGPDTYFSACLVSKAWLNACRSSATLLRLVALYQGGITRTIFMRLFALSHEEAKALPHTTRHRHHIGPYYLYEKAAIDQVMEGNGLSRWRHRLERPKKSKWCAPTRSWKAEFHSHCREMMHRGGKYNKRVGYAGSY